MSDKKLVLAFFDSEPAADAAAEALKRWEKASDEIKLKSVGVLVLDNRGALKTDKVGRRTTNKGVGIGIILAMVTPIGLAAAIIGGGIIGALHHKGLGLSDADRERIADELKGGKAAVGAVVQSSEVAETSAKLVELGGTTEAHELDDEALAEADAASAAQPVG